MTYYRQQSKNSGVGGVGGGGAVGQPRTSTDQRKYQTDLVVQCCAYITPLPFPFHFRMSLRMGHVDWNGELG